MHKLVVDHPTPTARKLDRLRGELKQRSLPSDLHSLGRKHVERLLEVGDVLSIQQAGLRGSRIQQLARSSGMSSLPQVVQTEFEEMGTDRGHRSSVSC